METSESQALTVPSRANELTNPQCTTQLVDSGVVNAILFRVIVALLAFEITSTPMMRQWMHGAK